MSRFRWLIKNESKNFWLFFYISHRPVQYCTYLFWSSSDTKNCSCIWHLKDVGFYFFLSTLHTYYILKHILGRQALLGWSLNNRNNKNWGKQVPFECEKRVAFLTCLSSVARSLTAKQKAKKQATNIYYIMTATQNECHFLFGNRKRRQREKR